MLIQIKLERKILILIDNNKDIPFIKSIHSKIHMF